jgi:hypothetical protein
VWSLVVFASQNRSRIVVSFRLSVSAMADTVCRSRASDNVHKTSSTRCARAQCCPRPQTLPVQLNMQWNVIESFQMKSVRCVCVRVCVRACVCGGGGGYSRALRTAQHSQYSCSHFQLFIPEVRSKNTATRICKKMQEVVANGSASVPM